METQASLELWPLFVGLINLAAAGAAAGHALVTKHDVRAAVAWMGVIILLPVFGWAIYLIFGINRIARRAEELRGSEHITGTVEISDGSGLIRQGEDGFVTGRIVEMARLGQRIAKTPYIDGNRIEVLRNGENAYPAMIEAIEQAQSSIALSTYIFNNDDAGRQFLEALIKAHARGVKIRILIDGVGSWYSFPSLIKRLRQENIPHARFLHSFLPWQMPYLNLRNHQKILVVDGQVGFTGSMNIAAGNLSHTNPKHPIRDIHYAVRGPVVAHLMAAFAHEWRFSTDELLVGDLWHPELDKQGDVVARGLPAGPDMNRNTIRWTFLAGLSEARNHVRIVTPYFLPDSDLITALSLAAMRGVIVDIVLPKKNNLFYMAWASRALLDELAASGCRIWMTDGPFDHAKIMTVDNIWTSIGSANWDPRSLRLNFEFNLECFSPELATELDTIIDQKIASAKQETVATLRARPLSVRLRDNAARLMSPYL
jgi:cardiolipin synthase A/B